MLFNINEIVQRYNLNTEEIAKVLFPNVKYPALAFGRVLKGETLLDVGQVEKLAAHIGIIVTDLFSYNNWNVTSEDNYITLRKGCYEVKLNYCGVFMSVYKNDTLIIQIINDASQLLLEEFIKYTDNIINNYENGNN